MKSVEINNRTFDLAINFKHTDQLRASFNNLAEHIYGFTFEDWYQQGYWGDNYIPYSLLDRGKVISNVSVSVIEFIIEGVRKIGIQIGTVMTDEKYRNLGLNKFIMHHVLSEWQNRSDFMYLFANDSVLDFYPKFNFQIVHEYQHSKEITPQNSASKVEKLNMEDENARAILVEIIHKSVPISKVSMHNNASLILFYCTSSMKNRIYYIDEYEAVVIANFEGDTLYIHDLFTIEDVPLNDIVASMTNKDTKKVVLGFTPIDEVGYASNVLKEEDTTLFVFKGQVDLFDDNHWMFPILSHA